jgi:hypothetical protein
VIERLVMGLSKTFLWWVFENILQALSGQKQVIKTAFRTGVRITSVRKDLQHLSNFL